MQDYGIYSCPGKLPECVAVLHNHNRGHLTSFQISATRPYGCADCRSNTSSSQAKDELSRFDRKLCAETVRARDQTGCAVHSAQAKSKTMATLRWLRIVATHIVYSQLLIPLRLGE